VFFYDLGDPGSYLAAERIVAELPLVAEWQPVSTAALDGAAAPVLPDRDAIAARAAELGLQPLRWPPRWPPETHRALLAATYAKHVGRVVAFSLAAFRQAFAGGRDLGEESTVLIAAAACEIHPNALLKGIARRAVADGLARAGERALAAGVVSLPAVQLAGGELFAGERALEAAAAALAEVEA
jgi:2-hydroxychromene-2-carboxylate isomerase